MFHDLLVFVGQRALEAAPWYFAAAALIELAAYFWPDDRRER